MIPYRAMLIASVVAAVVGAGWWARSTLIQQGYDKATAEYTKLVVAAQQARDDEILKRLSATKELEDAQKIHGKEVAALYLDLDAARRASRAESAGLHTAALAAAARARAQCADTAATAVRSTASDAIGVLAYVFERADTRAGVLGGIAEERGIAGRACERSYDAAREKLKTN